MSSRCLDMQDKFSMHIESNRQSHRRLRSQSCSLHETPQQVSKKTKLSLPRHSQSTSEFWNNLSKAWLTRNALRELDRRNNQQEQTKLYHKSTRKPSTCTIFTKEENLPVHQPAANFLYHCPPQQLKDMQKYARLGGPDLTDLRGYPNLVEHLFLNLSSRTSKYQIEKHIDDSRASSTSQSTSQTRSSGSTMSPKSGPYDHNFQQHLIDHGIYPHSYEYPDGQIPPKPNNWGAIKERLTRRRSSLSSVKFTEEAHEKFIHADANAFKEKQVMESIISVIEGENGDVRCVSGGIPFRNLDPLTDGTLVSGNPDHYVGARPEQLNRQIRNEISGKIIPSTQHDLPILPNFFLAVKGPDGSLAVARRQASYDGALGARAMHSLQTYGQEQSDFDNNAYTITSIYHGGTLRMFTSHPSKTTTSGRTEYHMSQLRSISLIDTPESFREGVTWFRNARDWTKYQRNNAIRRANEQAASDVLVPVFNASFSTTCKVSGDE